MYCVNFTLQPVPSSGSEAKVEVISADKSGAEIRLTFPDSRGCEQASIEEAADSSDEVKPKTASHGSSLRSEVKDDVNRPEVKESKQCDKRVRWNLPDDNLTTNKDNLEAESRRTKQEESNDSWTERSHVPANGAYESEVCLESSEDRSSEAFSRRLDLKLSNTLLFDLD